MSEMSSNTQSAAGAGAINSSSPAGGTDALSSTTKISSVHG